MASRMYHPDDSEETIEPKGCLAAIFGLFGIRLQPPEGNTADKALPYRLTQRFLSAAGLSFYKVALQVLPEAFVICSKPRIGDILFIPRDTPGKLAFENKIRSKHVDFLICDVQTMTPQLVVELDDKSHDRMDRQERDEFIDRAFAAARLEVLHFRVQPAYVPNDVRVLLMEKLSGFKQTGTMASAIEGPPECPNCRVTMVQRTATKGSNKGSVFWGCPNYPNCRQVIHT